MLNSERRPCVRDDREWKPLEDDMNAGLSLATRNHCTATVAFVYRYSFESRPPLLGYTVKFAAQMESIRQHPRTQTARRYAAGLFPYHEPRVPHISPDFGEMWELTEGW